MPARGYDERLCVRGDAWASRFAIGYDLAKEPRGRAEWETTQRANAFSDFILEARQRLLRRGNAASEHQCEDGQDEEHEEQDLRDSHGARGNTAESENRSDQRNHKKNGSPMKHPISFSVGEYFARRAEAKQEACRGGG